MYSLNLDASHNESYSAALKTYNTVVYAAVYDLT